MRKTQVDLLAKVMRAPSQEQLEHQHQHEPVGNRRQRRAQQAAAKRALNKLKKDPRFEDVRIVNGQVMIKPKQKPVDPASFCTCGKVEPPMLFNGKWIGSPCPVHGLELVNANVEEPT